jgi:hypothetical protein
MPESADSIDENPPYTDDEKVYLEKNWRRQQQPSSRPPALGPLSKPNI